VPPGEHAPNTRSAATNLAWLVEELSARLASAFETMAGERPAVSQPAAAAAPAPIPPAPLPASDGLLWKQSFAGSPGQLWISSPEPSWTLAADLILRAAGIEQAPASDSTSDDADRETRESTFLETLGQALGGVAQSISARLGREVTPSGGGKESPAPDNLNWTALDLSFGGGAVTIYAAPDAALLDALTPAPEPAAQKAAEEEALGEEADDAHGAKAASKTFDLLLDVEMPVSVSFGRAKVPLKDVLQLTTGSLVELNRSLVDPVEVIVNNCVIARGEVVVVEGNFGVRIQEVVSRRERLRTLN
jgi:flagellar motor switch protein FliN/FliY